nr:riboflavin synthase [bacterium]
NDSVAIDGVCLTVVEKSGDAMTFNLVPQTLQKTTLGVKIVGDFVNLERAMGVDVRVDGHFVQGHVDCTGRVLSVENLGESWEIDFEVEREFQELLIPRGSIAIDGISLTVAQLDGCRFTIAIIPHTLELTTLKYRKVGDSVNIEFDMLGKYVVNTMKLWQER